MGWTRLDSSWFRDKRHRPLNLFARLALLAAVQMSEERDWRFEERYGFVPRIEFDAEEIARHLELTGDRTVLDLVGTYEHLLALLNAGVAACERYGLLLPAGEFGWYVDGWERYRKDPTAKDRQARSRAKKKKRHGGHSDDRDAGVSAQVPQSDSPKIGPVTDVTVTPVTEGNAGSDHPVRRSEVAQSHRDHRDVTPRNAPPEEELSAPPPPESAAQPTLPGLRVWAPPSGPGARSRIQHLERELKAITFDPGDDRVREARLQLNVSNRNPVWIEQTEALLQRPRKATARTTAGGEGKAVASA